MEINKSELIEILEELIESAKDDEFQYGSGTDFGDYIQRAEEILRLLKESATIQIR